jgi:signal transduction histidine kinase
MLVGLVTAWFRGDDVPVLVRGRLIDRRHRLVAAVGAVLALDIAASLIAIAMDAAQHGRRVDELVAGFVGAITAVVGAVVVLSVPRARIGWFILGGAALGAVAEALTEAGVRGLVNAPGSVPAASWLVMLGVMLRTLPTVIFVGVVPAYFPDGRLPGPRWRWLRWVLVTALVLTVVGGLVAPVETRLGSHWHGPLTPPGALGDQLQALDLLAIVLTVVGAVGAAAGLVSRWRHRGPLVRQQLLLFACAVVIAVVFLLGVLVIVLSSRNGSAPRFSFALALLPIPLAVAVATLNHGLYDLRRAANRTILWLIMTVAIAVIYVVVVVAAVAFAPDHHTWWAPAIAATASAVALIPLRDRLQRLVSRVVYGRWQEPYELLSGLAGRLEAAADVDRLLETTVGEIADELDLHEVSVRDPDGRPLAGAREPAGVSVTLHAYGTTVGSLRYRHPDRELSGSEQRLIRDLARHLGTLVHARSVLHDLRRTRERLVAAREEERRRLRRDLHDGIGPALAGLTLKAETAVALLPEGAERASRILHELSEQIRATVTDVRRIVEGLRPPALDELGLENACRQAVARLTRNGDLAVTVTVAELPSLPAATEVAVFHIVLEAVTNVVRHAGASNCEIALAYPQPNLVITIVDDGIGLPKLPTAGNGLATMRERAEELGGTLTIESPGPGARVTACLPTNIVPATMATAPT